MKDGSLPLQAALIAILRANAGVVALVAARSYDRAPQINAVVPATEFPFVSLGPEQVLQFGRPDNEACEVHVQIDCWSRAPGRVEAKKMQAAVIDALDLATPTVTGWLLKQLRARGGRVMPDPDGRTTHAMVDVKAVLGLA